MIMLPFKRRSIPKSKEHDYNIILFHYGLEYDRNEIPLGTDIDELIQFSNEGGWADNLTLHLLKLREELNKKEIPESQIQSQTVRYARGKGFKVYRILTENAPDRLFFSPKGTFFIEFKRKGKKPNPKQEREHKELFTKYDQTVFVVDNIKRGKEIIDNYS